MWVKISFCRIRGSESSIVNVYYYQIWTGVLPSSLLGGRLLAKDEIGEIDCVLAAVKFPSGYGRTFRVLASLGRWKASELRNLLFYGPPYFADHLPADLFHHFLLFVYCIRTLCSDCLVARDINEVRGFLFRFCELTGRLYGREHLTPNNHLCCHLADMAAMMGPLHSFGAFAFESNLGHLKDSVFGGVGYLRQVCVRNLFRQAFYRPTGENKVSTA